MKSPIRGADGLASSGVVFPLDQGVSEAMMQPRGQDVLSRPDVVTSVIGILRQLDMAATESMECVEIEERRAHPRYSFAQGTVPCHFELLSGEQQVSVVLPRNLSAGGASFVKYGYTHEGTRVQMMFTRRDGQRRRVEGTVVWCRMVRGNLHEVGVTFGKYVSPHLFCSREAMSKPFSKDRDRIAARASASKPAEGMALCIGDDAEEVGYIATVLAQDGLLTEKATSLGQGLDRLRQNSYAYVVIDLDLEGFEPADALMHVCGVSGKSVVVGMTWSGPDQTASWSEEHSAVILQKPVPSSLVEEIEKTRSSKRAA